MSTYYCKTLNQVRYTLLNAAIEAADVNCRSVIAAASAATRAVLADTPRQRQLEEGRFQAAYNQNREAYDAAFPGFGDCPLKKAVNILASAVWNA